jgi:hypothetical protein
VSYIEKIKLPTSRTDSPNLADLSYALRHLPSDWKWDYGCHATCAMALAAQLWPVIGKPGTIVAHDMVDNFGISFKDADAIFLSLPDNTTPDQVADAIDRYVAEC